MCKDSLQEFDKCKTCKMPLENPQDACPCNPIHCFRCCQCPEDCVCDCKKRMKRGDQNVEF
ncbi:MAG: hypothetical protein WA103_01550 [Minisyncoccales bacterium]